MSVITGVENVLELLVNLLKGNDIPKKPTNRFLLEVGVKGRKGVNAHSALANFLSKKRDLVPIGTLPSGENNVSTRVDRAMFESIFDEFLENAVVEVIISPEEIALALASNVDPSGIKIPAKGKGIIK